VVNLRERKRRNRSQELEAHKDHINPETSNR